MFYRFIFRAFFQKLDPEFAHELVVAGLKAARILGLLRAPKPTNSYSVMGLNFENLLGMAAGFDKNGQLIRELHALGFGHVEIGTVTPRAQPGNPKPRLFRLPKNRALINRMGFNNEGADVVADRIRTLRNSGVPLPVIGINIGKNRDTSAQDAASDYELAATKLAPLADYLVINVSSPNTAGLRDLQQVDALRPILTAVLKVSGSTPVLLKIAPDLATSDIEAVTALVNELNLAGMVATNTTISRSNLIAEANTGELGGLSGPMLQERALEVLELIRAGLDTDKTVISVGGVFTRSDLQQRIDLGADLVQGYTGFVYGGPAWAKALTG
ncbi:quinone-dependent dihydroorotate dehydrogenase [Aquiluna sp.]|nr:quinone-dependent dihydroorotate dehydrogenase [Aquiluna sp.]MDA8992756.1 quinone-dependent dihydroorotate dehydrogenase [Aquiluna sp.]